MNNKFFKSFYNQKPDFREKRSENPFLIQEGRFSFGSLKDPIYYSAWTEEAFLADTRRKEIVSLSFDFSKLKYFFLVVIIGLVVLLSRAFWLQINKNNYYNSLAEGNRLRTEVIEPKRGIIYDSKMQALVRNRANFVLYFKPAELPHNGLKRDTILRQISNILANTSSSSTQQLIKINASSSLDVISDNSLFYKMKQDLAAIKPGSVQAQQPLFIASNISYDKALLLKLKLVNWPGVFLTTKIRREYLLPTATSSSVISGVSSFSHILGYTGKITKQELKRLGPSYSPLDYVGKTGLEYFWEKELRGVPGEKDIEVDALGHQKQVVSITPAIDGDNLKLSLDAALQEEAEKVTRKYIKQMHLRKASVVIMNPNNGEILALVSLPTYNNNLFAAGISQKQYNKFLKDPDQPLFNRAISGEFPSGSVIKPIFAAGALQDHIITATTTVLSTGGIHLGKWFYPDWKPGGHGITNVKKAIAMSVNTFFYYIGGGYKNFKGLGVAGLAKWAHAFGLGHITGIDLPGEKPGFIPTAAWKKRVKGQDWYVGDTYHFAIGQGYVLVTPLQVADYISAFANGGTLYRPHLVSQILTPDNKVIKNIPPIIIRQGMVSNKNMQIVREGMRQTVTNGTARSFQNLPVKAAAKTGTAQWAPHKPPHAWFVAFAPYNHPQIAMAVLVEEGIEGADVTARITHEIMDWYFTVDHPVK